MQKFNQFIREQQIFQNTAEELMEKLITFGGSAYPKFGNIVIMAGGAGSGKDLSLVNWLELKVRCLMLMS